MNNFIEKIKKKSHRRQGSEASQNSANNVDDTSIRGFDISPSSAGAMHESPSFRIAPLILRDDNSPIVSPTTHSTPINIDPPPPGDTSNGSIGMKTPSVSSMSARSFHGDLGVSGTYPGDILRFTHRKSRFSNNLMEVLNDPVALGYFVTFMDSRGFKHLVKFYLDTETFRVSATRLISSASKSAAETSSSMANGKIYGDGQSPRNGGGGSTTLRQMTEQDAVAIFAKYISKEAAVDQNIGATDELRNTVINRICDVEGRLDSECFAPAQEFVLNIMEKRFFADYQNSVVHCKYVLELLNTGRVYITDILYNDVALFHFTEFMEQDGQRHLIEFWLSVDSFQQQLNNSNQTDLDIEQTQRDAMVLYDRYFSMQATSPLGFDDDLRMEIENNICREDGLAPAADCFEKPFRYILNLMEQKYLPRFMVSAWYERYLSELVSAAQCFDLDLPNPNRPRVQRGSATASTISSGEGSTSSEARRTVNTLLAHESPSATTRRRQVEVLTESGSSDMAIETLSYDPNSLWKRDKRRVGFGHVDSVGRYVREYSQASQHRRTMSGGEKISEAMRKLVHKDNKEKEALAEEVAALIIKDVTSMTCGLYDGNDDSLATGSLES